ncbi:MAG: NFACT RNA binding domain-containing protein, partial [Spirochaetota bacterium]
MPDPREHEPSTGGHAGSLQEAALRELGPLAAGSVVRDIRQLGERYLLLFLDRRGERHILVAGWEQRACRLHLLFERVHREYLRRTPAARVMAGRLGGAAVTGVFTSGSIRAAGVLLSRGGKPLRLVSDAGSGNLLLCGPEGAPLAWLRQDREPDPAACARPWSTVRGAGVAGSPGANRSLSREFFRQQDLLLRRSVSRVLKTEERKVARLLDKLREEQEELDRREELRVKGELLKRSLRQVPKGADRVALSDFQGRERIVELDPALDSRGNMERYFHRYKRLKRKAEVFGSKLSFERERLAALQAAVRAVEEGGLSLSVSPSRFIQSLDARFMDRKLEERLRGAFRTATGVTPAGQAPSPAAGGAGEAAGRQRVPGKGNRGRSEPFLRLRTRGGAAVLVGRSARGNDLLTLRTARGNDLWFHVEEGSGSHVVLRYTRGREFLEQDIRDASQLALYFSSLRSRGAGTVVYTL